MQFFGWPGSMRPRRCSITSFFAMVFSSRCYRGANELGPRGLGAGTGIPSSGKLGLRQANSFTTHSQAVMAGQMRLEPWLNDRYGARYAKTAGGRFPTFGPRDLRKFAAQKCIVCRTATPLKSLTRQSNALAVVRTSTTRSHHGRPRSWFHQGACQSQVATGRERSRCRRRAWRSAHC